MKIADYFSCIFNPKTPLSQEREMEKPDLLPYKLGMPARLQRRVFNHVLNVGYNRTRAESEGVRRPELYSYNQPRQPRQPDCSLGTRSGEEKMAAGTLRHIP